MRFNHSEVGNLLRRIVVTTVVASLLAIPVAHPGAGQASAADGMTTQTLVSVSANEGGGQMVVLRIVIEPGVALGAHSHPGLSTFAVISGTLQTSLVRGGAAVNRNGVDQVAEIGAISNLSAGQAVSYSPRAIKTVTNHGPAPLVLMATMLLDPNEPMVAFEDGSPLFQFDLG
jgi:hypothetical protein